MALRSQSLFLYGYAVSVLNQSIDFQSSSGGPVFTATLDIGQYSLTSLLVALAAAMQAADPANTYTWAADRTIMGGTQNRVSVSTSGSFLSILFNSGPNASVSVAGLIGFNPVDYLGQTRYVGSQSTGNTLIPEQFGYNYEDPVQSNKVFGAVNVSAAGIKEAVVFNLQSFVNVEFKYEPKTQLTNWQQLFQWLITQKPFDFTPEITSPTVVYSVTLDKTQEDGKGMAFKMKEMLPNFPNFYQTGPLMMRIILNYTTTEFEV